VRTAAVRTEARFSTVRVVRTAGPVELAVLVAVTLVTVTVGALAREAAACAAATAGGAPPADPGTASRPTSAAVDIATARHTAMIRPP
jgi:hypothetical protein